MDLAALLADIGPLLLAASAVSGLMCWRDLDVMLLAGPDFSPADVLRLLARIVARAPVTALEYHDERGERSPTGQQRDERYHVPMTVPWAGADWRVDLTLWLHDPHHNVTRWMRSCARASPTASAARCSASRTSGTAARSTRTRSAGWRSTPPCWTLGYVPQPSSRPG